ncbi:acyltransferase [Candidatus Saccharibacteria bacterium]|nr:acyltransferase [Candidatus Saccharibacteria bacterium]
MRRVIIFGLAAFVVAFLWMLVNNTKAFAVSATWNGTSIINYEDKTYNGPANELAVKSLGLPTGAQAYTYIDPTPTGTANTDSTNTNSPSVRKIHIIYFEPGTSLLDATNAKYETMDYVGPNDYKNPSAISIISISQQASPANPGVKSCSVTGGMGWVICPISNTIANAMDYVFSALTGYLHVTPVTTNTNTALYRAWSYMRGFANVAFLIVFLIIIYSQLTSLGISNYGIKKLLPRLIIAAILVNLSYYICAIGVDISNILGQSVQGLFMNLRNGLVGAETNNIGWKGMTEFVLSGGTAATAGLTGLVIVLTDYGIVGSIYLLLPVLMTGLFSILVALLVMACRQALVTILVIVSPLAFVAYLLPNTEKWFEKWQSTLMTMLILFPAFSAIYGGSQLAASAIIQNADSINLIILGMMVQVAPLMITPMLIKLSGSMIGKIANFVSPLNRGIVDRTRKFGQDRADNVKAERLGTAPRPGVFGMAQRNAHRREHSRRRREHQRGAFNNRAEARYAGSADYSRIDQFARESADMKSLGESTSELQYNSQRSVMGTRAQNLDSQLRATKHALGNAETAADNVYKGSAVHRALHQDSYNLDTQKNIIEQTLDRDLKRTIASTPGMLREEMRLRTLTDQAAVSKGHLDNVYDQMKAHVRTEPLLSDLNDQAAEATRDMALISISTAMSKKQQQRALSESLVANVDVVDNGVDGPQLVADFAGSVNGTVRNGAQRVRANASSAVAHAINEEIKEVKDGADIPTGPAGMAMMEATMRQAIADQDTVTIRAYVDLLTASGNPGVAKLRELVDVIDNGLTDPADLGDVKAFINANPGVNGSAEDIAAWSRDGAARPIADITADPETWNNVNALALSNMKASTQLAAIISGGVSEETMRELLDNESISGNVKPEVKDAIRGILP